METTFATTINRAGFTARRNQGLHILAALVLLLFAMSAFADLIVGNHSHDLYNSVFPFLYNKTVFLIAAIFETAIALCCLRFNGQERANYFILAFLVVIFWYRWAFFATGGLDCGCSGILTKLLHISKRAEGIVPKVALVVLTATIAPWIFRGVLKLARRRRSAVAISLLAFSICCRAAEAGQTVEIAGEYSASAYNPKTHQPYNDARRVNAVFKAIINENKIKISVTNQNDPSSWAQFIYDGTNSYTFNPYDSRSFHEPDQNISNYTTVSKSPFPESDVQDRMGLVVPWITYGLASQMTNIDGKGSQMPLPWFPSRIDPKAFGYRWKIVSAENSSFVSSFEVVRDRNLDLNEEKELLRPELMYADSVAALDHFKSSIKIRKNIPSGFVEAKYKCLNWVKTNGLAIPSVSQFEYYLYSPRMFDFPWYKAELTATSITVRTTAEEILPPPSTTTLVRDFRFREADNAKHIFEFAQYRLRAGDSWKGDNDPALIAEAASFLKHGPKYDSFVFTSRRILVWVVLVLVFFTPLAVILIKQQQKQQTKG